MSGGTASTMLSISNGYPASHFIKTMQPFALSAIKPSAEQKKAPVQGTFLEWLLGIVTIPDLGVMIEAPSASLDTAIVNRSWSLFDGGAWYGRNFRFAEYLRQRNVFQAKVAHDMLFVFKLMLVFPFTRWILSKFLPKPGQGATREESRDHLIVYKAVGVSESGKRAVATFEWKGNMYDFTAVGLVEAALEVLRGKGCKALELGGLVTPATLEMGYVERLQKANVKINVNMLQ
jgi:short subunit dehydrogenase-like uncharacterized protein